MPAEDVIEEQRQEAAVSRPRGALQRGRDAQARQGPAVPVLEGRFEEAGDGRAELFGIPGAPWRLCGGLPGPGWSIHGPEATRSARGTSRFGRPGRFAPDGGCPLAVILENRPL